MGSIELNGGKSGNKVEESKLRKVAESDKDGKSSDKARNRSLGCIVL